VSTTRALGFRLPQRGRARVALALVSSSLLIAGVTGVMKLLELAEVPVLSLGALYLFAIVPIAIVWGVPYAVAGSVVSMLAYNFFFLPPLYTFTLADSRNWFALLVYLVTGLVVSELAARGRRRAAETKQRAEEAALLADTATELLRGERIQDKLTTIAGRVASILGVERARLQLGEPGEPPPGDSPLPLVAGQRRIGTLYVPESVEGNLAIRRRFLPALASLIAVAADRERLEREAVQAETLRRSDIVKTAVLQAVSHDLRSPLTAIQSAIDGLTTGAFELPASERATLFETIKVETRRLNRLVENLLDLSKLQAEAAAPSAELWTIDDLVAQALADVGPDAERVHVAVPDSIPPVRVDADQIERVLVNVIENALKFSSPAEAVHVSATSSRTEVLVRVVDHGPGLRTDDLERVFEPFERGRTSVRGMGLGLAICRGFVEANGGRIWAESHPGQGATFVISLPAAPMPAPMTVA
jgi:two-component system sensor histidine kinase KdpD